MRWLLQRGDSTDDAPKLLTLEEPIESQDDRRGGIASLPGGALSITVRSASEARDTLVELQRIQQELLTARARATGNGVVALGSSVMRQVQRPSSHLRRAGSTAGRVVRGLRPASPINRENRSRSGTIGIFDGLNAALLIAEAPDGIEDAIKLVGSAISVVGDLISDIDLGDISFD